MTSRRDAVLITGASGLIGRLIAAVLLANDDVELVLPIRETNAEDEVRFALATELEALGAPTALVEHAHLVTLPPISELHRLREVFESEGVRAVVHCAGSMSYRDKASLQEGNLDFTRELLRLAERASVERFVYMSTAFASGLVDEVVPETLHAGARVDPAEYMRSKRDTEWLVAESGLPYLIVRPSIVIGDSRDGRYPGRPYGLYQVWSSAEKFASKRYMPVIHAIAPRVPLQVIHQDALQNAFHALYHTPMVNSVVHIAGRAVSLPTVRDLWDLWLQDWLRPEEVHYYDKLNDVPLDALDRDQRLFVQFAAANIEISTHAWRFETQVLDRLRLAGLEFPDASIESIRKCQSRFLAGSAQIQQFFLENPDKRRVEPRVFENHAD